jgi:outer membrane biogenesis lipoprotein LolB
MIVIPAGVDVIHRVSVMKIILSILFILLLTGCSTKSNLEARGHHSCNTQCMKFGKMGKYDFESKQCKCDL